MPTNLSCPTPPPAVMPLAHYEQQLNIILHNIQGGMGGGSCRALTRTDPEIASSQKELTLKVKVFIHYTL